MLKKLKLEEQPKVVRDFWRIVNNDEYAWIPIWGEGRCGKTTLAMILMYSLYKDWDDVLNAVIFNLGQLLYKLRKGEPRLFPTITKPCHMRVPILLVDDFAAQCGKAKTQHEKAWDIFKGSFDTLGTRVGILLASMIEPTSPTEQLLLKYTHEIKVEKMGQNQRLYKYDRCIRQQDFKGWKHRQKKSWLEEQEFGKVPIDVYKQYDEMRMALVEEVIVSVEDSIAEDSVGYILKRISPIERKLLERIREHGPISHQQLSNEMGKLGQAALAHCKARGLIVPSRKGVRYYVYDLTDLSLDVLKALEEEPEKAKLLQPIKVSP